MAPIIEDENIVRAQLVRRKDEDKKYKARANLLSFYKQMYALISGGHDVLIHAEGTVVAHEGMKPEKEESCAD